jgi:hypothetical protein
MLGVWNRVVHAPGSARWALALLALSAGVFVESAGAEIAFTEFALSDSTLNSSPSTDFWIAAAAPADVDSDGDLDLLIAGYYVVYFESVEDRLTLYRNDGALDESTWALTPIPLDATDLVFSSGDLAWGDYDNDGDPDVVVGSSGATTLYRNDGGSLIRTATVLADYWEDSDFSSLDFRSLSWADWDRDGDLDLLLPSTVTDFAYAPTKVLRNDGPGAADAWTFTDVEATLPECPNCVSAWADREGDGDLDLLLAYVSPAESNYLEVYATDASGNLVLADTDLAHIRYGMADWGDIDNDGDPDIVYGGNMDRPDGMGETLVRILKNDGPGAYTPIDIAREFESPELPWLDFTAVAFADYDSDGDSDLLVSGEWLGDGEIFGQSVVYVNDAGAFTPAPETLSAPIVGNAGGAFTWFDVDSDGDLDYFVAGGYYMVDGAGLIEARTQLFRNDATQTNGSPSPPLDLSATMVGVRSVELGWTPASDDRTPPDGLTYELEVFRQGGAIADDRARPEPGNVGNHTAWTLRNLRPGDYTWSVQALDTAFNGSSKASGTFSITTVGVGTPATAGVGLSLAAANPLRSGGLVVSTDRVQDVQIALHDVCGREVLRLHDGPLGSGSHVFTPEHWGLASGTYFVRASGSTGSVGRRVTLIQ